MIVNTDNEQCCLPTVNVTSVEYFTFALQTTVYAFTKCNTPFKSKAHIVNKNDIILRFRTKVIIKLIL